jgi:hypothetical protein
MPSFQGVFAAREKWLRSPALVFRPKANHEAASRDRERSVKSVEISAATESRWREAAVLAERESQQTRAQQHEARCGQNEESVGD